MSGRGKTQLSEEFREETFYIRGVKYVFRELDGEKYEEFLKLSEGPDGDANLSTVLRLMIPESMVEPKLTVEQIYRKPLPVLSAIQNIVNKMHFATEPVGEDPQAEADGDDEEKAPNELEPQTS